MSAGTREPSASSFSADESFGRDGVAVIPPTRQSVRAYPAAVAVGPGDRICVAASAASELQGFREDSDYSHALVARFKGRDELSYLCCRTVRAEGRELSVSVGCSTAAVKPCRIRLDVLDRRDRRIARARRSLTGYRDVRLRLARPARRGERLTLRLDENDAAGRSDRIVQRVTVPRGR